MGDSAADQKKAESISDDDFINDAAPKETKEPPPNTGSVQPDSKKIEDDFEDEAIEKESPTKADALKPVVAAEAAQNQQSKQPIEENRSTTQEGITVTEPPKTPGQQLLITELSGAKSASHPPKRPVRPTTQPAIHMQKPKNDSQQGNSILSYNPSLPPHFTDKATIEAMRRLGLTNEDITYPSAAALNLYSRDPEFREMARKELCGRVDELISQVRKERDEILKQKDTARSAAEQKSQTEPKNDFVEMERQRIERYEVQQKKEVERLLLGVLIQQSEHEDQKKRDEKAKQKREEQRVKEEADKKAEEERIRKRERDLEAKEKERRKKDEEVRKAAFEQEMKYKERLQEEANKKALEAEEEEKKRREKAEAARKRIESIESERRAKSEEKQKESEQREELRLKRMADEQQKMKEYREQRVKYLAEQIQIAKDKQAKMIEERRRAATEKDAKVADVLKKYAEEKEIKVRELREKEQMKVKKFAEVRIQSERAYREKARTLQDKEIKARLKLEEIEEEREKRMDMARKSLDENSVQKNKKIEEFKKKELEQKEKTLTKFNEREGAIAAVREKQERDRAMKALSLRLQREKRGATAVMEERKKEASKEIERQKYEEKMRRIEEKELKREEMRNMNAANERQLSKGKEELKSKIEILHSVTSDTSSDVLKKLATEFGIDFEELQRKVKERRQSEMSALPPISASQGTSRKDDQGMKVVE